MPAEPTADLGRGRTVGRSALAMAGGTAHRPTGVASWSRFRYPQSLYKYAAIFGYNLMLHRRGKRPDPMYEGLTDTIVGMIDEGIALLDRGV